jgi:hypothetical protein
MVDKEKFAEPQQPELKESEVRDQDIAIADRWKTAE